MTTVLDRPIINPLTKHEEQHPCQYVTGCEVPAAWYWRAKCCGAEGYVCHGHRLKWMRVVKLPGRCRACFTRHLDRESYMSWRPL